MNQRFTLHFSHLPLVQRVLFTGALCVLSVGYLFAMIYVFESHHNRDGKPGLSVQDIVIAYSGNKGGTQLEAALKGPMSGMLPAEENLKIITWLHEGAPQAHYDADLKRIFDGRCITCHNSRNPHLPSLESYAAVQKVAVIDSGVDLFTLVRVSHIHLFGLTFIFFMVSSIFVYAYVRKEWLKITLIAIPFVFIILDILSWYLTKLYQPFAWVVMGSGALMALSFGVQVVISLYQMWFYRLPDRVQQRFYCAVVPDK